MHRVGILALLLGFAAVQVLVLCGCPSTTPCPGTAPAVYETCSCDPVERRMLSRANALDPILSTALSSCVKAGGEVDYEFDSAAPLTAKGRLKACIERRADLDSDAKLQLIEVVEQASAEIEPQQMADWNACYRKVVGIEEPQSLVQPKKVSVVQPEPCRHESHGIERYTRTFQVQRASHWMGGGYDPQRWCNDAIVALRGEHPKGDFEVVGSSETSKNTCWPSNCPQYKYFCTVLVKTDPVYVEKASSACPAHMVATND